MYIRVWKKASLLNEAIYKKNILAEIIGKDADGKILHAQTA